MKTYRECLCDAAGEEMDRLNVANLDVGSREAELAMRLFIGQFLTNDKDEVFEIGEIVEYGGCTWKIKFGSFIGFITDVFPAAAYNSIGLHLVMVKYPTMEEVDACESISKDVLNQLIKIK